MVWCIHTQVSFHRKMQKNARFYSLFLAELRNAQFKEGELANLSNSAEGRVLLIFAMKRIGIDVGDENLR